MERWHNSMPLNVSRVGMMARSTQVDNKGGVASALLFFFLSDTATPEIYPLPLHDALPISPTPHAIRTMGDKAAARAAAMKAGVPTVPGSVGAVTDADTAVAVVDHAGQRGGLARARGDRKSTRLNFQSQSNLVCRLLLEKKKWRSRTRGTPGGTPPSRRPARPSCLPYAPMRRRAR